MLDRECVVSCSLWFRLTHIHTHTPNIETCNKCIFILALPWLFTPSSITLYWNSPHPVSQSLCFLCECFWTKITSKKVFLWANSTKAPFASKIVRASLNHGESTAFTKSINWKSQVLHNVHIHPSHTQMVSELPCRAAATFCLQEAVLDWVFARGHFHMLLDRAVK